MVLATNYNFCILFPYFKNRHWQKSAEIIFTFKKKDKTLSSPTTLGNQFNLSMQNTQKAWTDALRLMKVSRGFLKRREGMVPGELLVKIVEME